MPSIGAGRDSWAMPARTMSTPIRKAHPSPACRGHDGAYFHLNQRIGVNKRTDLNRRRRGPRGPDKLGIRPTDCVRLRNVRHKHPGADHVRSLAPRPTLALAGRALTQPPSPPTDLRSRPTRPARTAVVRATVTPKVPPGSHGSSPRHLPTRNRWLRALVAPVPGAWKASRHVHIR